MWRRLFRIPPPFRGVSGEVIESPSEAEAAPSYQSPSSGAKINSPPRFVAPPWSPATAELSVIEGVLRVQGLAFKKNPTMGLGASPSRGPTQPTSGERIIGRLTFTEGQWCLQPVDAVLTVDGLPVTGAVPLAPGAVVELERLGEPPAGWIVDGVDAKTSAPLWGPARCGALTVTEREGGFHAVLRGGAHSLGVDSVEWLRRFGASLWPTALQSLEVHLAPTDPMTDWGPFVEAARRLAERLPLTVTLREAEALTPVEAALANVRPYGAGLALHPGADPVFLNGATVPLAGWCTLAPGDVVEAVRHGVTSRVEVTRAQRTASGPRARSELRPWAVFPNGSRADAALTQERGVFVLRHGDEVRRWVELQDGLHELNAAEVPAVQPTPFFSLVHTRREEWRRALTGFVLLPGPSEFLRGLVRLPQGPLTEELVAVFADALASRGDCAAPGLHALASRAEDAQAWHEKLLVPYARRADPLLARRTLLLSGEHCAGFFTTAALSTWKGLADELPQVLKQPMLQRLERLDLLGDDDPALREACRALTGAVELRVLATAP